MEADRTRCLPPAFEFILKDLSIEIVLGNEVYYTIFEILLVKNMVCSKFRHHKTFKMEVFTCQIDVGIFAQVEIALVETHLQGHLAYKKTQPPWTLP